MKFMKRAGVIGGDNLNSEQQRFLNALEALNPTQAIYYQPQTNQQSPLTNYVAPNRQLATPQQEQQTLQDQRLQQQQQALQDLKLQQQQQALQDLKQQQQQQALQDQRLQQQQLALQVLQQLTPQQKQLLKQQLFLKLQQLQAQRQQVQQQLQSQQSYPQSNVQYPETNEERKDSGIPGVQDVESKSASKVDRQGLYDGLGYDQGYSAGYLPINHAISNDKDGYADGRYPEPVKEVLFVPKPSVNIKIDPANILRLLLGLIPKPLLNLNGKVFFGVELGKQAGITKGVGGYAAPVYGGGGKGVVLNLG